MAIAGSTSPIPNATLECRGRSLSLDGRTHVVGILNVTPDSFFDGGRYLGAEAALLRAEKMVEEGASMIDVGGQSTRPGYVEVSDDEEIARVAPVISALVARVDVPISIDTYKPKVALAAIEAGAHVLNDIHGLQRVPELARMASDAGLSVIAMHHDPKFQALPGDRIELLRKFFRRTLCISEAAGLARGQVVLDPGIGFFKTPEQNLELMGRIGELHDLGCPLMLAASRKSVIGHVLGGTADERLEGTLATTAIAAWHKVAFVRVHDVLPNVRAARMSAAMRTPPKATL